MGNLAGVNRVKWHVSCAAQNYKKKKKEKQKNPKLGQKFYVGTIFFLPNFIHKLYHSAGKVCSTCNATQNERNRITGINHKL